MHGLANVGRRGGLGRRPRGVGQEAVGLPEVSRVADGGIDRVRVG